MISKTPAGGSFRTSFRASIYYLKRDKTENDLAPDPGFQASLDYLRHGTSESAQDRTDWIATRNLRGVDPELAAEVMRGTASCGNTEKPVYHRIISLAEGERLSREQMERVTDEVLKGLGLTEHQVLMAQHTDNGKQHVHLIVNRVHPRSGRVWDASHDYAKTERVLRRLEKELGLEQVPGRHWVERGQTRYQGTRKSQEPFAERARGLVGDVLAKASDWQEVHVGLAQHGLSIEPDKRNRGLVVTDGTTWAKASSVSRKASRPALEKRLGAYEPPTRDLEQLRATARKEDSWKAVERKLSKTTTETRSKWGVFTARDRLRQYSGALDSCLAGTYRNPAVARRRIERSLHTHGWKELRREIHRCPEKLGRLHGALPSSGHRRQARRNAKRLPDAVRRWRAAERTSARADFTRSVRQKTCEAFRAAKSWDELHAALRRERLRLRLASTGKALLATDGRAAVPTFQLDHRFGKKKLEQRLGAFQSSSHALDRLAEVTRQLRDRERLDRLLASTQHKGLKAKAELDAVKDATRTLEKARRAFGRSAKKVFREPDVALRALRRSERRHGEKRTRLAASQEPRRFGQLRGGRVGGAKDRRAALREVELHLPYRLHDVQAARRELKRAIEAQPAARRALERSRRAVRRLRKIGARLGPQDQLARQAQRLAKAVGWNVTARLLPAPHYQALRISVSLARKAGMDLGRTVGR